MQFEETPACIPCCLCGIAIEPNPTNMCLNCLRQQNDIAQEIPNTSSVVYCKTCDRYQTGPTSWARAELESQELMHICLNRLTGLKDMKITNARFLYTEPHSKRIRISLTVEKPFQNTILRQTLIITFVVQWQQCPQCCEEATPREHWVANVQLRQGIDSGNSVKHKRTLYWLEQQILNCGAHSSATAVERKHEGLDFHFGTNDQARNFVKFLKRKLPVKDEETNKLMGEDIQNSKQDRRFTYIVRVPPINRQEFVILPKEIVYKTGNQSFIGVCYKIGKTIKLVDPVTARVISVEGNLFWDKPFSSVLDLADLRKFVVLTIETTGPKTGKFQPADVELTDEETYQDRIIVKTHLGAELKEGESCLAYDLRAFVIGDDKMDVIKKHNLPEVIIVGRVPMHKSSEKKKSRQRPWHVKTLAPQFSDEQEDFEEFLEDLEENPDFRRGVDIYRNPETADDDPQLEQSLIALSEMKVE